MPRPERALDAGAGPVESFAAELRELRSRAGNPGYRELAEVAGYSAATLANAAGGRRLASWPVTLAFVTACGGDVTVWEHRWRQVAAEAAPRAGTTEDADGPAVGDPPYLGLRGFGVGDADLFFGRDRPVAQLVRLLARQPFLAVFGVSGSGKSSLLRAGLVPALAGDGPTGGAGNGHRYVPVLMTPGARPVDALRGALRGVPADRAALVVVDQFEEVFTLCADPAQRTAFVGELAALVSAPGGRGRVVVGVRADFYARCAGLPQLAAMMAEASVPVGPLSDDELREVVTGPAKAAGLTVERALVTKILADASGQPGALPLVSHALLETWRQRRGQVLTVAGYEAAGGVAGAIAQTAEAVYAGFDTGQRATARQLLLRLVSLGEGVEDTRRRVKRTELEGPGIDEILDRLAGARLVTLGEETVEIAHEALIRAWPRLQRWLSADREGLRIQRQLGEAAQAWLALDRDAGSLYRGARLELARELASGDDLNHVERAFLEASIEQEHRERAAAGRRSRQLRYLTIGLAVLLVIVTAISVAAVQQRRDAVQARQIAISRQLATQALALVDADPGTAMLLSVQAFRIAETAEARSALLSMAAHQAYHGELIGHTGPVSEVRFAPDGRTLLSVGRDQTVGVWDTQRHRRLATLDGHHTWLKALALSPDGRTLATGGDDRDVVLWDVAGGARTATLSGHSGPITEIAFSPDGRTMATASADATVVLWDVAQRTKLARLTGHTRAVKGVTFSPDGRTLATASEDTTVVLWDVARRTRLATLTGHAGAASAVTFSPDGRTLATAGGYTTVFLWDVATRTRQATFTHGRDGPIVAVKFSPDGRTVATAGTGSTVMLWDTRHRILRARLPGAFPNVYTLDFNARGTTLAAAGEGGVITLWDVTATSPTAGRGPVNDVTFSPDGRTVAAAGHTGTTLWNTADRTPQAILAEDEPASAAFSPDGRSLATTTRSRQRSSRVDGFALWDARRPTASTGLIGHADLVLDIAFSPDSRLAATASIDHTVILWDLAHRTQLATLTHSQVVNGVAFSPDGRTLATASHDQSVKLWNVEQHTTIATLTGHTGWVRTVAFSPDGRILATADTDQTVIVWDVEHRTRLATITDHADAVYTGIAFSPDGHTLAYTSADNTVVLWDVNSRTPTSRLAGHTQPVKAVAFSPDGKTVASAGADETVILWDTDPHRVADHVCQAISTNLTEQEWRQFIPNLPYQDTCVTGRQA